MMPCTLLADSYDSYDSYYYYCVWLMLLLMVMVMVMRYCSPEEGNFEREECVCRP